MKSLEKLSDKELMRVGQNGKKDAVYSIMYKKYFEPVKWFLLKKIKNHTIAEDISQETFMKLYKSWETYKENSEASVKTWVYKIAMNRCTDYFRKINSESNLKVKSFSEFFTEDYDADSIEKTLYKNNFAESPEEELEKKERDFYLNKIIENKLNGFRVSYPKIAKMRYFDELSHKEIAEKLGIPIGTSRVHISRVRELLFEELNKSKSIFYEK